MSTEWATRWERATVDEYLDHIWSTFYPIDKRTAEEFLVEESVQEALHTICGLHDEGFEIDPDDKGMQFMAKVTDIVRDTGVHAGKPRDTIGNELSTRSVIT